MFPFYCIGTTEVVLFYYIGINSELVMFQQILQMVLNKFRNNHPEMFYTKKLSIKILKVDRKTPVSKSVSSKF